MNSSVLMILSLSVSGSILALVLLASKALLKHKVSKAFLYYVWILVLLRLVVPFAAPVNAMDALYASVQPGMAIHEGADAFDSPADSTTQVPMDLGAQVPTQPVGNAGGTPGAIAASSSTPAIAERSFSLWGILKTHLVWIWLAGAIVTMAWYIAAYLFFSRRIRKSAMTPHKADLAVFRKLCSDRRVKLVCSSCITTPMLIGVTRPAIVIPQLAYVQNSMERDLINILQHELTHYRRKDFLYKWLVVAVTSLHWFNPLMIIIRREIVSACELSCDEAVINGMTKAEKQAYGNTLLALSTSIRFPAGIFATTMGEEKKELKERLISIMKHRRQTGWMIALSLVLALALTGCAVVLGAADNTSKAQALEDIATAGATDAPQENDLTVQPNSTQPNTTPPAGTPDTETILPLNPNAVFAPIPFSDGDDMTLPSIPGCEMPKYSLTLAQAMYSLNYARSYRPIDAEDVLARCDEFIEASAVATTVFGNGEPTAQWIDDQDGTPFTKGDPRPAWCIIVTDPDSEAHTPYQILVDAQTGDLYSDTKSGGYYPSPYPGLSSYAQISATPLQAGKLTENQAIGILTRLNHDLWHSQYATKPADALDYVADNAKNRFILDWGKARIDRSSSDKSLRLVSEPKVSWISVTSMKALDANTVKVKYKSFVEYDVESGTISGTGSDQIVLFEYTNGQWVLKDIGMFPWGVPDYYDEYAGKYGDPNRNNESEENGI